MGIKKVVQAWNSVSLVKRIVIGLVIGGVLGVAVPNIEVVELLGTLFVSALKGVAPILVFFLVISALANARAAGSMKTVVLLYVVSTFVAALVAVVASFLFPIELTLSAPAADQSSPSGIGEVLGALVMNVVSNPVDALMNANYIGILAWAVAVGMILRKSREETRIVLGDASSAVSSIVQIVIRFAPIGIFGLVSHTLATEGFQVMLEYAQLLLVLLGAMAFVALVLNPFIVWVATHDNPYPLTFMVLRESGVSAFFTRSSAANIPVNMDICRRLKLPESTYAISIPVGSTINMAGAAVTITVITLSAAHSLGIQVDMFSAIFLCRIAFDAWMKHTSGTRLSMHGPMELRALSGYLSHFPFLKRVKHVGVLTLLLVMVAVSVGTWRGGLQYGVDFSGGVAAQVRFEHPVSDKQLIGALDPMHLEGLMTQQYGDNNSVWLLRFGLPDMPAQQLGEALLSHLQTVDDGGTVSLDRLETVGPKVGDDLRSSALEAIYYALLLITVYISGRFEQRWGTAALLAGALTATMIALQWMGVPTEGRILAALLLTLFLCWRFRLSFAAGAMASLIFDVTTTTSLLVILGQEIDLNIVAALLTIIGYSLNDTIVIYDRIRETLRRENPDSPRPLPEIIQEALGDTMSRTLLTAGTTLVAALALFLLGGPVIYGFALTMLIGVFMGTISSLFVAAPMLPLFGDTLSFKTAVTLGVFERPGEHGVV